MPKGRSLPTDNREQKEYNTSVKLLLILFIKYRFNKTLFQLNLTPFCFISRLLLMTEEVL